MSRSVFVAATVAAVLASQGMGAGPAVEKGLIAYLAFDGTADAVLNVAGPHTLTARADGCKVDPGGNGVILDGRTFVRVPLPKDLTVGDKTMAAWVNMSQSARCGGAGIVTLQTRNRTGEPFDSIVWNERRRGWMFGSER